MSEEQSGPAGGSAKPAGATGGDALEGRGSPSMAPRTVAESRVTLTQAMGPEHANLWGHVHGGTVMRLVDTAAGYAAIRHCRCRAVTARIDELDFLEPVMLGDLLIVKASVNDVGRSSMEVGVRVEAENVMTGEVRHVASAYLVFVALDDTGAPRPVPPLIAETPEELRRMAAAKLRREYRHRSREAIAAIPRGDALS